MGIKILRVDYNDAAEAVRQNEGYCPCKLERTPDTKCMCKQFREQITNMMPGLCECGLYEVQICDGKNEESCAKTD